MAGVRSKRRSSGKFQGWFTDYTGERKWFDGTRSRAETLRTAQDLRSLDTTPQSHSRAMTVAEITRLLEVCPPSRRLLLETAFVTGLRANELRNLTVHHLDVQRCGLHLDAA